ncbi:MarR family winged helix-turn-helix transcriptional regulator [Actinoplanes derwentensis]|uniref:DNA-binding transcriptional regulator, MarR family n=1 Tax=Actinoplanes derwentensis TaxID=113562 RepID=A0A1H1PJP0_9ACTN|nr:MarR family transcriptional regulator [Actinoplanes derwentensis]GID84904.1 MarR family transcriptional regulator [Actinoplanes derwentensis]SDS11468.1 DNA-binding transcriptional regulator, MarR family [Actinoplanes derwentensis]
MSEDGGMAVDLMHLAHQLHRSLERRVETDFVHPKPPEVQIVALWQVRARPGLTVRELADDLQLKPNNASALVTAMVNAGLLRREADQRDRRVVRLHATEEAGRRVDAVQGLFTRYLTAALDDLDEKQRAAVQAALPALGQMARHIRDGGRRTDT